MLIGLLCLAGLITGLVSDDWGDALAALGLGIPALVSTWGLFHRKAR